jgi:hypothetical protein
VAEPPEFSLAPRVHLGVRRQASGVKPAGRELDDSMKN